MNTVLAYLKENWSRLDLTHLGLPEQLSCVLATPRFKTSTHVLFFVLAKGQRHPVLVAKTPRLAGDNRQLEKETSNLRNVHAVRAGGFDSIPKVIAFEDWRGHRLLIETAVEGQPLKRDFVRLYPHAGIEPVTAWIIELHAASAASSARDKRWFERLVETPVRQLQTVFPSGSPEQELIGRLHEYIASLRALEFPLVFEHGDFCSPNILIGRNSRISVVDWELAEPNGLPAVDIFFFLNFAAFSKRQATENSAFLSAFRDAFFGGSAWAVPYIFRYSDGVHLKRDVLKPLFLLCWTRIIANVIVRLKDNLNSEGTLTAETVTWLRESGYYLLWKYTIEHLNDVNF